MSAELAKDSRQQQYEAATQLVRWAAITIILVSQQYVKQIDRPLLYLLLSVILFNLSRISPLMKHKLFASHRVVIAIDCLFIALLLTITGGIASPYYALFSLTIVSASYWYGFVGLSGMAIFMAAVTVAILSMPNISDHTFDPYQLLITNTSITVLLGALVERLGRIAKLQHLATLHFTAELQTERQRLMTLLNTLVNAVIVANRQGEITLYNSAALELLDTKQVLTGQHIRDVLKLRDAAGKLVSIMQPADKIRGFLRRDDLHLNPDDGSMRMISLIISPVHNDSQGLNMDSGYVYLLEDITKAKTYEERQNEFISVVSHELRTPLAIAEANLSTALLPDFAKMDAKALPLVEQAHKNVIFLGDLIKGLTTLSISETDDYEIETDLVDPMQLAQALLDDYRASAHNKGLALKLKIQKPPATILTNENKVREIIQNLLTNAIKYTEKGSITLSVEASEEIPESVVFSVHDSGIGIAAADHKLLFKKFFRAGDYRTRQTSGSGLGLYITKKLANQLGGKLWFSSKKNRGSTFYLLVPPMNQRKG